MANGGMGFEGSAVARLRGHAQRSMEIARAINHAVIATEWLARVILLLAALLVLYYAADRKPPFEVYSSTYAEAPAGEYVTIHAKVRRDADRGCNVHFWRYMYDSTGTRFDLGHSQASAEAIAQMGRRSPGTLSVAFRIPSAATPGPATLQTVLQYHCNRVHYWWPIEAATDMAFTVLP